MSHLYRPVRIETAEQARDLPVGTIALSVQDNGGAWRKRTVDTWVKATKATEVWTNHGMANPDAAITALIPIEAEDEWGLEQDTEGSMNIYDDEAEAREWARLDGEGQRPSVRYVTSWEEQS